MLTILADRVHFKEGTGLQMALVRVFGTLPINEIQKNRIVFIFFSQTVVFHAFIDSLNHSSQ